MQNGIAVVGRSGNIEESQFICPLVIVTFGNIDGIARIAKSEKIHAFDDAAVFNIQARDDSFAKSHADYLLSINKLSSQRAV